MYTAVQGNEMHSFKHENIGLGETENWNHEGDPTQPIKMPEGWDDDSWCTLT